MRLETDLQQGEVFSCVSDSYLIQLSSHCSQRHNTRETQIEIKLKSNNIVFTSMFPLDSKSFTLCHIHALQILCKIIRNIYNIETIWSYLPIAFVDLLRHHAPDLIPMLTIPYLYVLPIRLVLATTIKVHSNVLNLIPNDFCNEIKRIVEEEEGNYILCRRSTMVIIWIDERYIKHKRINLAVKWMYE